MSDRHEVGPFMSCQRLRIVTSASYAVEMF